MAEPSAITVWIDGDACPVREETYKVALRHKINVKLVANSYMRVPEHELIERIIVSDSFDAADDFIAENADARSIVITADILLAERVLKSGALCLSPKGEPFTMNNIGSAIAARAIMADLRAGAMDENIGGPKPFSAADRSYFLQSLHNMVERLKRAR